MDAGIDPRNVVTMTVVLPDTKYAKAEQYVHFFEETLRRARALPGVESVSGIDTLPLNLDPWVVYYNKEIFDAKGVAYPKTFAEMIDAAGRLNDPGKGVSGFVARGLKNANVPVWSSFLLGYGGDFLDSYMDAKIIDRSPFDTIDKLGVGWLVRLAAWTGREEKPAFPPFGRLSGRRRDEVRALVGILRVADALDRSRAKLVRQVTMGDVARGSIRLVVAAAGEAELELSEAQRRAALLARCFGRRMVISPATTAAAAG